MKTGGRSLAHGSGAVNTLACPGAGSSCGGEECPPEDVEDLRISSNI